MANTTETWILLVEVGVIAFASFVWLLKNLR